MRNFSKLNKTERSSPTTHDQRQMTHLSTVSILNEFGTAIGLEYSLTKSKSECMLLNKKGRERGECSCTYNVINLQNTTHSLGGQLNGTG